MQVLSVPAIQNVSDLSCALRLNQYDGIEEYWVQIRETAKRTQKESYEEKTRSESQAL